MTTSQPRPGPADAVRARAARPGPDQHAARGAVGLTRRDHLIEHALAYAARGWHVFPLRPGDKRPAFPDHAADRCTGTDPRCRRNRGHVGWEQRATTDPARIRAAWSAAPYGIGIATGPSRLVVIDLDTPKPGGPGLPPDWAEPGIVDGADVLCLLAERAGHPAPLDTYTVATPTGGLHLYYLAPAGAGLRNTAGTLAPMVDTRAGGGYVVAPPTVLTRVGGDGAVYRVLDDGSPVALPGWLAERLTPRPAPVAGPVPVSVGGGDGRRAAYLQAAVRAQLDAVTSAGEGGRNRALYVSATALGQLAAGGELDPADVTAWLTEAARAAGLTDREAGRTIASGLRAGANRPRTLATSPAGAAA